MKYLRLFEDHNNIVNVGEIKKYLLDYYNINTWKKFIDTQEMGQCQEISKLIETQFGVKRMYGSIEYDEESECVINHYWNEFNNKMYDFAKGTISDYIDFGENKYVVEVGEFWSLYVPF